MWKRAAAAAAFAVALVACKQTPAAPAFVGLGEVAVVDVRIADSGDGLPSAAGGAGAAYVIAEVRLTNATPVAFAPEPARFVLTDPLGARYNGVDAGSSALVGIVNPSGPLDRGAARVYTIAFRVAAVPRSGTVAYEP